MTLDSLDTIFTKRLFRIPDYQRGYAWRTGKEGREVIDFWEDLLNLGSRNQRHYTGVLTLEEYTPSPEVIDREWLLEEDYKPVHVVDGQQRLTTAIILIKAFCDFYRSLNPGKDPGSIIIGNTKRLSEIEEKYIIKITPDGVRESFIFGYEKDNPSDIFLKKRIFGCSTSENEQESFYTLNLSNAKTFFDENLKLYYDINGQNLRSIDELFRRLTMKMVFNVFQTNSATDDFDIFVAFETMNNRGRSLSNLELLKNRLIYLTTLLPDIQAVKKQVRGDINNAWKGIYEYLGKNKEHPLDDDEFLYTHWVLSFPYSRKDGSDYIRFLLGTKFTTKNICDTIVKIEDTDEREVDADSLANMDEVAEDVSSSQDVVLSQSNLTANYIRQYVISLNDAVKKWYSTWFPKQDTSLSEDEILWLDRLNRIGISYFRPLVTASLMVKSKSEERTALFKAIERFIFVVFRTQTTRSNYRSSEFYSDARKLLSKEITIEQIIKDLNARMGYSFKKEGEQVYYDLKPFHDMMNRKFEDDGNGYYGWGCRWYFLYEYEMSLAKKNGNRRVVTSWQQFIKSANGKITIEHIYPQTPTEQYWIDHFNKVPENEQKYYQGSIGNLLLLSQSINSSLRNDGFDEKKTRKEDENGNVLRLGYENGSYSEVEVSKYTEWTPETIEERGMAMMKFMAERWDLPIKDDEELRSMLFLPIKQSDAESTEVETT